MALPPEIDSTIAQAIEHLRRQHTATGTAIDEGLLYLGPLHDAYPSILVRDPFLTDSAKIQWLFLAQEARQQPQGAIAMPTTQETTRTLHQARGTVIRDRLLLRICRWISVLRRVRDSKTGRYLGQVYAMHGEPVQLHAAIEYDDQYIEMIERSKAHQDKCIQRAAHANLLAIHNQIMSGEDPLTPVDSTAARITAANSIGGGWGTAWNMALDEAPPGPNFGPGDEPRLNPVSGEIPRPDSGPRRLPSPNSGPGGQVIEFSTGPNLGPGVRSSVCSNNKTTTTNPPRVGERAQANPSPLNWPKALDDDMRRLLHQTLNLSAPVKHHQDVLDAIAHKLADHDDPLRNPVAYAITLCGRIRSGTFQPVGPPLHAPLASESDDRKPDKSLTYNQLRNELSSLKQLRIASGNGKNGITLDRQIADIEAKLSSFRDERC